MVRQLILQIAILTVFCGTARVSMPSVDELLDRFAATMDRCQASYVCTEEGTKVSVIRKALSHVTGWANTRRTTGGNTGRTGSVS
jgi:hypothetical protein